MESNGPGQSLFGWMFSALGPLYMILLPLAGILSFLLALLVVTRGKGPIAGAALLLVVNVPLFVGIFSAIQGLISSYVVIAQSGATPKPFDVTAAMATALIAPLIAMLFMVPGYLVALVGSLVQALGQPQERADHPNS
jgi:hypothetical protein